LNGGGLFDVIRSFGSDVVVWMTKRNSSDAAVGGLALATSLSFFAEMVVALFLLHQKVKVITYAETVKPFLKKLLNTIVMIVGMYYVYKLFDFNLDTSRTIQVIILTVCTSLYGIVSYLIGSKILEISEVDMLYNRVKDLSAPFLSRFIKR